MCAKPAGDLTVFDEPFVTILIVCGLFIENNLFQLGVVQIVTVCVREKLSPVIPVVSNLAGKN